MSITPEEVAIDLHEKRLSKSVIFEYYEQIIKERLEDAKAKADRYKKMFYILKGSCVTLQSSGILSLGSTFFTDGLAAKIVAFSAGGIILVLEGLDRMLKSETRYHFYNKKYKSLQQLQGSLIGKRVRGESLDEVKNMLKAFDDTDSYDK